MTEHRTYEAPRPGPTLAGLRRIPHPGGWGGVAAGLGRQLRVQPGVFRAAFVIACFFGGFGIVAYAALWLLVPEEGTERRLADDILAGRASWSPKLIIMLALAGTILVSTLPGVGFWPIAIVAVILWLVFQANGGLPWNGGGSDPLGGDGAPTGGGSRAATPPAPPEPAAPEPAPPAATPPAEPGAKGDDPPPAADDLPPAADDLPPAADSVAGWDVLAPSPWWDPPPSAPVVAARRPPSPLPWALAGIGGVVVLAGVLHLTSIATLPPVVVIGLSLVAVLNATVVGMVRGRWASTLVLAIPLTGLLLLVAVLPGGIGGGIATRVVRPASAAEVDDQRIAAGSLTLDLRDLETRGGVLDVDVEVGAGRLEIVLPPRVAAEIEATAMAGRVEVLGTVREGLGVASQIDRPGEEGAGRVVVHAAAGLGQVLVRAA